MAISGKTQVLGVIGDPIAHSLSPLMHQAFAEGVGQDTVYVPFRVAPEGLETALTALPALSIRGVNVTVPHKERVIPFLDECTEAARAIGAVNTVSQDDGRLVGDNTDSAGFLEDLRNQFADQRWASRPALVLGAGGAARAVVHALGQTGIPEIRIANRDPAKAERLAAEVAPERARGVGLTREAVEPLLATAGLLVNTTSLGLKGEAIPAIPSEALPAGLAVYDLIYSPAETPLLQAARRQGLPAANGLGMLVRQGAMSFQIWTGTAPRVEPVIDLLGQAPTD